MTFPGMWSAAAFPLSRLRTANVTSAPCRASSVAATLPMPLFAPVTMAVVPERSGRSSAVQRGALMASTYANFRFVCRGHEQAQCAVGTSKPSVP